MALFLVILYLLAFVFAIVLALTSALLGGSLTYLRISSIALAVFVIPVGVLEWFFFFGKSGYFSYGLTKLWPVQLSVVVFGLSEFGAIRVLRQNYSRKLAIFSSLGLTGASLFLLAYFALGAVYVESIYVNEKLNAERINRAAPVGPEGGGQVR